MPWTNGGVTLWNGPDSTLSGSSCRFSPPTGSFRSMPGHISLASRTAHEQYRALQVSRIAASDGSYVCRRVSAYGDCSHRGGMLWPAGGHTGRSHERRKPAHLRWPAGPAELPPPYTQNRRDRIPYRRRDQRPPWLRPRQICTNERRRWRPAFKPWRRLRATRLLPT